MVKFGNMEDMGGNMGDDFDDSDEDEEVAKPEVHDTEKAGGEAKPEEHNAGKMEGTSEGKAESVANS
ncbi:unnamed protein product [Thlaspi arvense]|uniref:Uncharacterized protein n=1 Tax=Thlaspi arvense TaxID=13288 RepID=A0AAU9RGB6_THLAR|nr:unnamed protein product [Thlaspi arvense]